MHPLISEAMVAARQRDIEASLERRRWAHEARAARARTRRPPRVVLGMSLIGLGLRLLDIHPPATPPVAPTCC